MINIKVKCIDAEATPYRKWLNGKNTFSVIGFIKETNMRDRVVLKRSPRPDGFFMSRFQPIYKKITLNITLPDDLENIKI